MVAINDKRKKKAEFIVMYRFVIYNGTVCNRLGMGGFFWRKIKSQVSGRLYETCAEPKSTVVVVGSKLSFFPSFFLRERENAGARNLLYGCYCDKRAGGGLNP